MRKEFAIDPDGEASLSFIDGFNSFLSIIEKSLDEGQPAADENELNRILFDTLDKGISAMSRNADPNDELTHTMINGYKTFFTIFRNYMENGGTIQSSDGHGEMKQAIMNFLSEIQSRTDGTEDEIVQTTITVMKGMFGTGCKKYTNPNNEVAKALCDCFDAMFSIMGKIFGNGENRPTDKEIINEFVSHFNSIISALVKRIENGKVQSIDRAGEAKPPQWGTSVLNKYLDIEG
jgi:hypothetical protein